MAEGCGSLLSRFCFALVGSPFLVLPLQLPLCPLFPERLHIIDLPQMRSQGSEQL